MTPFIRGIESALENLISVIVPACNEEGNIEEFCRQFDAMVKKSPRQYELVFVDDGSSDNTWAKIETVRAQYPYLKSRKHPLNLGLTDALKSGFSAAAGDIYVFYPADLQYKPEDIPTLVEPIFQGADVTTGWKMGKYKKKFVSSVYNALSRKIFGLKVHDLNSVKAFRAAVVKDIFLRKDWHRYLVVLAVNRGYRVDEVRIPLYDRNWGKSKFSIGRIPVGVLDMLAVKTQMSLLKKPLLFFGMVGMISLGLAVLVGLVALYYRFVLEEGFRPLLYLVIFLTGIGMAMFIIGFLSEGLASLKEELEAVRKKLDSLENRNDKRN